MITPDELATMKEVAADAVNERLHATAIRVCRLDVPRLIEEVERLRRVAEAVERGWTCTAAASEDCYCGVLDEAVAAWKEGRDEA